jgi:5'-nucleotidase
VSFRDVGRIVEGILPDILRSRKEIGWNFININVPNVKPEQIAGVRPAAMNCSGFEEKFQEHKDPRGGMVYWMMGGVLPLQETEEDDTLLLRKGYVTITPLRFDLTNYEILKRMKQFSFSCKTS